MYHLKAMAALRVPGAAWWTLAFRNLPKEADPPTPAELQFRDKLLKDLPTDSAEVKDINGGCSTMHTIDVVSKAFRGLSVGKQHQLVTRVLGSRIPEWHGFTLKTRTPTQP